MKYVYLVWKNLWRKKTRTILTILSIFVAFILYGLLGALKFAFTSGAELANAKRLVVIHKVFLSAFKSTLERIGSVVFGLTMDCTFWRPSTRFSLLTLNFIHASPDFKQPI